MRAELRGELRGELPNCAANCAAYSAETFARSAWAVQMFEVALSRRMCCSRVCIAMRYACGGGGGGGGRVSRGSGGGRHGVDV